LEKILVIDDNKDVLNLMDCYLTRHGYDVNVASGGAEGIELLNKGSHFDVVITDIRMPGTDGNQVAKCIRDNEKMKDTPIIAITGYRNDAKDDLFDYLFSKPFQLNDLVDTVKSIMAG
jgi:CheY-like chemotaxis protein